MKHEVFAARVDSIAMLTGIIAGLAAAGAALATPTGFTAFGVWLGLVDEPWIVRVAPMLDTLATVCGTASGFSFFYAKLQKRRLGEYSPAKPTAAEDHDRNG